MITYSATVDVPRELVAFLSRLLSAYRRRVGTRRSTRVLTCWRQAEFALVWCRERRPIPLLGRNFGLSQATAYRYLDEALTVLAEQAPDLHETLRHTAGQGWAYVILDGTIVESDRCGEKTLNKRGTTVDAWYSGKTHGFGGNVQAVIRPDAMPLWVSDVVPGSTHDLTAARPDLSAALQWSASQLNLPTLADAGYRGAGIGIHTPIAPYYRDHRLDVDNRCHNTLLRSLRYPGERAFALLAARWRALQHITASPSKITTIIKATLVLTQYEHNYLTC